jgi:hypothetical protein
MPRYLAKMICFVSHRGYWLARSLSTMKALFMRSQQYQYCPQKVRIHEGTSNPM